MLLECARPRSNPLHLQNLLNQRLDFTVLYTLAEEHGLTPLASLRLSQTDESFIPINVRQKLTQAHRASAISSLLLTGELFRLLQRFATAGLETVVVKGPVLSMRCYGDAGVRQYADLDLIVRTRDMQHATQLMLELGYEPRISPQAIANGKIPGEYVFRRRDTNLLVEFHTEHTFRYHPRPLPIDKVFARKTCVSIDQQQVPALSVEDELVLICIHAAKHMWERLAWVADVAALLAHGPGLKWQNVTSAATEVGAERMLRVGIWLAADMLHAPLSDDVAAYVNSDSSAIKLARQIAERLADGRCPAPGIVRRAGFRVKMRGALLPGLSYLLRLSLSPTEDDWSPDPSFNRPWLLDAISRPFRLARKYRREVEE